MPRFVTFETLITFRTIEDREAALNSNSNYSSRCGQLKKLQTILQFSGLDLTEVCVCFSVCKYELYCDERAAKIPLGMEEAAGSSYSSISNTKTFLTFCRNMF